MTFEQVAYSGEYVWNENRIETSELKQYQVFGERRSGTNFVNALVGQNTDLKRVQEFGWKHGFPVMPVLPLNTLFIVVVRSPMDWLKSLYKQPYEVHKSLLNLEFSDFIRAPWETQFRPVKQLWNRWGYLDGLNVAARGEPLQLDRHPLTGKQFVNCLDLRNTKNLGYLSFLNRGVNVCYVRYEDAKGHPEAVIEQIRATFDLKEPKDGFRPIERTVSPKFADDGHRVVKEITMNDQEFIINQLDWSIEQEMGFALSKAE